MLLGSEIKSIRKGDVNLKGAYVSLQNNMPVLKGAHISRYAYDTSENYEPFRDRQLLLNQNELEKIERELNVQGVTIVPLYIGIEGKYAKLQMALVRGKKKHDKRETMKAKDSKRQIERALKNY